MTYLNEKEVSRRLGVSIAWLRKCRMSGIGGPPFARFGSSIRYPEADLEEWAKSQIRPSTLTPAAS
jgi:predicted DNA-binding transcriptional regulator AlpA